LKELWKNENINIDGLQDYPARFQDMELPSLVTTSIGGGFSIQGQCLLNVIDSVFEFVDWPGSVASFFFIGLFYPGGRRI
jgi:hypothetical protein